MPKQEIKFTPFAFFEIAVPMFSGFIFLFLTPKTEIYGKQNFSYRWYRLYWFSYRS